MSCQSQKFKDYINTHLLESKESALAVTHAIQKSELNAGGGAYTRTLHVPKFFTQEDKANFQAIVGQWMAIFQKVIQAYRADPDVRKIYGFDKELEELILLEPPYSTDIPICRIDIFYNEQTKQWKVCEFNTDGTSAMNENARLNEFLKLNNAWNALLPEGEILELVDAWIDAFLKTCQEANLENPAVAIADYLERAYRSELYVFERRMKERGIRAEVADVRDFVYEGGKLKSTKTNTTFDAVYRRAVTKDVMEFKDESQAFLKAVKDGNVLCIGQFQTQLIHHKKISLALKHPALRKHLTKEERDFVDAHLPTTYLLDEADITQFEDKDQWILKPLDSYASKGVWCGHEMHEDQWKKVLSDCKGKNYIIQEYVTPYYTENIDLVNHNHWAMYSNLTGLYVYRHQFAGVYSRMSDSGIISTQYNEKTVPTIFINV